MKKNKRFLVIMLVSFMILPLQAGERTIPVDMIVMVDKSLSMAESGKFESLHAWVRDQLIGQILIDGDWLSVYQFYGEADALLTMTVSGEADRAKIIRTIDGITPDGKYTDIGLALDTIKRALDDRGTNGRHKIMLLLTDLKQEAPWTSRYAGTTDSFESPYLAEARVIQHDSWYEITLDMDIQDEVVKTSRELYSSIQENSASARNLPAEGESLAILPDGTVSGGVAGANNTSGAGKVGVMALLASAIPSAGLPLLAVGGLVVVSLIVLACVLVIRALRARNARKEDQAD